MAYPRTMQRLPDQAVAGDPRPQPPEPPEPSDCCQSGCIPCVYDLYDEARERYQEALARTPSRGGRRRRRLTSRHWLRLST